MASRSAFSKIDVGSRRKRAPSTRKSRSRNTSNTGSRISPTLNPPQIDYQPWYRVILAVSHTASKTFTPAIVVEKIRSQLDPHGHGFLPATESAFRLQFKLHSIRCWNLTGRQIALSVNDYSVRNTSGQEQLCGLVDCGTALHIPCCGFKLPQSISNLVLRNDNDDKDDPMLDVIAPTGNSCMTYLEVSWRFDGPLKIQSFQCDMYKLLVNQQQTKKILEQSAATLAHISQVADESKPSFIERTISGVSKAAEVVAVAAGADEIIRHEKLLEGIEKLTLVIESAHRDGVRLDSITRSDSPKFSDLSDSQELLQPDDRPEG